MQIPYTMLDPDTLDNVIESFVSREGTDYGEREVSMEAKIAQVKRQLKSGHVVLVFDDETESCSIIPAR